MAWVGAVAQVIGTVLQVGGQQKAAQAEKASGQSTRMLRDFEAAQLEQQAKQEFAQSQRAAAEERRTADLLSSRAQALAASGGGGVSDPTTFNLMADIEGEGSYRASVALYQGEENARRLRLAAKAKRFEGEAAERGAAVRAGAYSMAAGATAAEGISSFYTKYGNGGP